MSKAATRIKIGDEKYVQPGEEIPADFLSTLDDDAKKALVDAGAIEGKGSAGLQHDGTRWIGKDGNPIDEVDLPAGFPSTPIDVEAKNDATTTPPTPTPPTTHGSGSTQIGGG